METRKCPFCAEVIDTNLLKCNFCESELPSGKEWFYSANGMRTGPVGETEISRLLSNGTIDGFTQVWSTGMADWQPIREVKAFQLSSPPPLMGAAVNNGWMWVLAFAPLIGLVIEYFVMQVIGYLVAMELLKIPDFVRSFQMMRNIYGDDVFVGAVCQDPLSVIKMAAPFVSRNTREVLGFYEIMLDHLWIITCILNTGLCLIDNHALKLAGHKDRISSWWCFLLVPVYMYKRAVVTRQSKICFILWLISFFLALCIASA